MKKHAVKKTKKIIEVKLPKLKTLKIAQMGKVLGGGGSFIIPDEDMI